jgi:drug/metabolite transporter (DMT)-like permease
MGDSMLEKAIKRVLSTLTVPAGWAGAAGTYGVLLLLGLLGAISDATLNQWARTSRTGWLLLSYALWIAVATLLGLMLKGGRFGFGSAVVVFLLANCVAAVVLDHAWFGRKSTPWEWAGIGLAVVAMCLIEFGRGRG